MIETPQIIQTEAEAAAIIHVRVPRSEMMKVFGPAVTELMETLARQGVAPASAVFAHHLRMSADVFDFELGLKVLSPVRAEGRVKPGSLPAARIARTVYTGSYEGLHAAWGEFDSWLRENGHEKGPTLWEVYTTGPHITADPAQWKTELNRPLKV